MIDFNFIYNNITYNYREKQPGKDGLYKLVDKSYVFVSNISLELQALINHKKSTYDLDNYKELRKIEYDKLNQLEMQYDDLVNNTNTWQEAIEAIKIKFPKPNEV